MVPGVGSWGSILLGPSNDYSSEFFSLGFPIHGGILTSNPKKASLSSHPNYKQTKPLGKVRGRGLGFRVWGLGFRV